MNKSLTYSDIFSKVCILTGGDTPERDVALATSASVERSLRDQDIDHVIIEARGDFISAVRDSGADIVFIAMHGGIGENGTVQALLEILDIPYTGSGVLSSALCMNKVMSKKIFRYHDILTPRWTLAGTEQDVTMELPVVVKPVSGGSTIATTIVRDRDQLGNALRKAVSESVGEHPDHQQALVEEYIPGREITVGILGNRPLPILEIESMTDFYDYEAKYESGMSRHYEPEGLNPRLYSDIQETACKAFNSLACRGMARVDFRLDGEKYYILEINSIPGMTQTSLLPEAAAIEGIDFNSLVLNILESAKKKIQA